MALSAISLTLEWSCFSLSLSRVLSFMNKALCTAPSRSSSTRSKNWLKIKFCSVHISGCRFTMRRMYSTYLWTSLVREITLNMWYSVKRFSNGHPFSSMASMCWQRELTAFLNNSVCFSSTSLCIIWKTAKMRRRDFYHDLHACTSSEGAKSSSMAMMRSSANASVVASRSGRRECDSLLALMPRSLLSGCIYTRSF